MKYLISMFIMMGMIGCGVEGEVGPQGPSGPQGIPGQDFVPNEVDLTGEYYLPYTGYALINRDYENRYSVNARFESSNPDDTICSLLFNVTNLDEHGGKLIYGGTVSLSSGNCRSDSDVGLSTSNGRTYLYQVLIETKKDKLNVLLQIYEVQGGTKSLVIDRLLKEEI